MIWLVEWASLHSLFALSDISSVDVHDLIGIGGVKICLFFPLPLAMILATRVAILSPSELSSSIISGIATLVLVLAERSTRVIVAVLSFDVRVASSKS